MWEGASIRELFVENVDGAPPYMEVIEVLVGPASLGEDIVGTWASCWIRHVIPQVDGMLDDHGPQACVGNIRPVVR
jgi:hypothetical protein